MRENGASYVVLDRKTPVARLVPLKKNAKESEEDQEWAELCGQMEKAGFKMTQARSRKNCRAPESTVAPDGRTDIQTVQEMALISFDHEMCEAAKANGWPLWRS